MPGLFGGNAAWAAETLDEVVDEVNRINTDTAFTMRGDDSWWKLLVTGAVIAGAVWIVNKYAQRKKMAEPSTPFGSAPVAAPRTPASPTETRRVVARDGGGAVSGASGGHGGVDGSMPVPGGAASPSSLPSLSPISAAGTGAFADTAELPGPDAGAIPPPPPPGSFPPEHTRMLRLGDRLVVRFPGGRGHWEAAVSHNDEHAYAVAYTREPARQGKPAHVGELVTAHLPGWTPARLTVTDVVPPSPVASGAGRDWLWLRHADIVRDDE